MRESRWVVRGLRLATSVILAFIYLPLLVLAIYAFNTSRTAAWPPAGFTLEWFGAAFGDPTVLAAFTTSIVVGLAAMVIALVLGTMVALAVQRFAFFGRETISLLVVLPIALPGVVSGIALASTFRTLDIRLGMMTIIVGHATFCVVIVYNNVLARLRRMPRSAEEASADLGADTWRTFGRITVPAMRTALLSGALLAFALSFDEVIVTNFTAGPGTQTIPLWILASVQRPTQLPEVNVVALVLIALSVIPVYLAQRIGGAAAITR
jgi:putative spermidine/putrescine transport system permease protein